MDLRPLRNDQDHTKALTEIERLWDAERGRPSTTALRCSDC